VAHPKIACAGWRGTSREVLQLCEEVGAYIVAKGFILTHGNAAGPDQAFARGANRVDPTLVHVYLPWPDYNTKSLHPDNHLICHFDDDQLPGGSWEQPGNQEFLQWAELARSCHPHPEKCSDGARLLLIRNVGVVQGANQLLAARNLIDHQRGGTNHAWRVADKLKVPSIDLSTPEGQARIRSKMR